MTDELVYMKSFCRHFEIHQMSLLTSLSMPVSRTRMVPVEELISNMFGFGSCGSWLTIEYLIIPFSMFGSSASVAVTVINS